jgi:hypothetical protein
MTKHNKLKNVLFHKVSSSVTFRNLRFEKICAMLVLFRRPHIARNSNIKTYQKLGLLSKSYGGFKFRNRLICGDEWAPYTLHAIVKEREYRPIHFITVA